MNGANNSFHPEILAESLASLPDPAGYVVAFSGGGDSTALLLALHEKRPGPPMRAVHVSHGLLPDAGRWADYCAKVCRELGVSLETIEVAVSADDGQGVEAAARDARYAALVDQLEPGEMLLTAHHRDDQAETMLLQLVRGTGLEGLAAMAGCRHFGPGWLARPLLGVPREALRGWLEARGLGWVDDPDNANPARARTFVRDSVLPLMASRWPGVSEVLARGADNLRDAREALDAWARADLARAVTPEGGGLRLDMFHELDGPRRRQVLRCWLREAGLPVPDRVQLEELEAQAFQARQDAQLLVSWPGCQVRRHRDVLYASTDLEFPDTTTALTWQTRHPLALPAGLGWLALEGAEPPDWTLTVRFRRGGERIRLGTRGHHTDLKTLFQDMAVPPWERARVPLVFDGPELAAVGDWCVAGPFAERLRAHSVSIRWQAPGCGGGSNAS
jgi:tRNA(Ile)-lysidine synthase